ncbi:MAG TPA: cation:proton antiporter [Candidatus Eisenbacteria bacterium]|nr:cation:proton antiporter [Candidatus Eisenbacteria bacterium]
MEHSYIFRDIALVFAAAFACGLLAWKLRQPMLLGYVVAGLLVSPLTPGPRVHDVHNFETLAEIGVILLMFSVGMEFSVPELLKVKWVALIGAPLGIVLCVGLGMGVGAGLGWPVVQGMAIGCIISVASTMVLLQLLMDRGEMATEHGRLMVTMSLVEDLAVVILTVVLPSFSPTSDATMGEAAWKVGKAILLLIPIAVVAWKVFPPLLARVERTCNDEISLLMAVTACMVIAALTELVGLSLALGAFLGGLFLGNSKFTHKLAVQTRPLREVFVALFFVSVGLLLDPGTWRESWPLIALLAGLVLVGKFAVWTGVVWLFRYRGSTAFRVGIGLTQIGEFSFILAQVSSHAGLISNELYHATLAASFLTILVNATIFKFVKPLKAVAREVCAPVQGA